MGKTQYRWILQKKSNRSVIKAIGNNEERKEITARRHKILTWKTLSNKER
jgi:hypothetical protein